MKAISLTLSGKQTAALREKAAGTNPPLPREPRLPIWEVIAGNMKHIPAEDFAALPLDGLSQIDHYIYGVPKRTS